jgi:hypothetical protein
MLPIVSHPLATQTQKDGRLSAIYLHNSYTKMEPKREESGWGR